MKGDLKVGDKITIEGGVVLVARLQKPPLLCEGCYFKYLDECLTFDIERSLRPKCITESGENLIFKEI